ncbi:MAG: TetR/AcrR family transcriptional regulator [Solirubrobacteraceae bacterium]|nr:TetR/AcrR family transcriptional regulator [Patulibacter sp.]
MATPDTAARERIIAAVAVVIARDGYRGSKIHDIAKEARVSLRTFYLYFPNKEALFLELHARVVKGVISAIDGGVSFDQPWRDAMSQGFETYFRILTAEPRLTTAIISELTTISDESFEAWEYARGEFATLMSTLVERGRAANPGIPSRPLSPLMARSILGGVLELVTSRVISGEVERLPELVDTATDLLWSVVTNVEG